MSVNQLKPKDWTKDGRKWIFQTRYTDLSGNVKKYKSKKYHTKKEAQEAERVFFLELFDTFLATVFEAFALPLLLFGAEVFLGTAFFVVSFISQSPFHKDILIRI